MLSERESGRERGKGWERFIRQSLTGSSP